VGVVAVRGSLVVLLTLAAWQDLRRCEVSAWILAGIAVLGMGCGVLEHALTGSWWWAVAWLAMGYVSRMGGADAKVLASLALCSPALSLAVWMGMAVWYVAWLLWRKETAAPVLPGAAVVVGLWLILL